MQNAFNTLEALQKWFYANGYPYWTLYSGSSCINRNLITRNAQYHNIDEAWEFLQTTILNMQGTKNLHVLQTEKAKGNTGFHANYHVTQQTAPAISGTHQNGQYVGNQGIEAYINGKIEDKVRTYEMERMIEDLQHQIEQGNSMWERLVSKIVDHNNLDRIIEVCLARMLGQPLQPAAVTMHGIPDHVAPPGEQVEQTPPPQQFYYDTEKVVKALDRMRHALPQHDIHNLLDSIAELIEQNPQQALILLKHDTPRP